MRRLLRRRRRGAYPAGSCTRRLYDIVPWVPLGWGDAYQWGHSAVRAGLRVDHDPEVGALAVWAPGDKRGPYGHVAYVCSTNGVAQFCVYEYEHQGVPGAIMTWYGVGNDAAFIHPPDQVQRRLPRGALHNGRGDSVDPIVSVVAAYESMRAYYNIGAAVQLIGLAAVGVEYNTLL